MNKTQIECNICNRILTTNNIKKHIKSHFNKNSRLNVKLNKISKKRIAWNKGLRKATDIRIQKSIKTREENIKNGTVQHPFKNKKLTDEHKAKISKSRIKYLKENPDKVPYLLNHSSKISYPEQTMIKYLKEHNISGWIHQMQFSIYQLDFAFPEYKLDVEIDGATHQQEKVKKIDKKRNEFLISEGWKIIRITAKEVQNNVYDCINKILSELNIKKIEIPIEFLNNKKIKEFIKTERQKNIEKKQIKTKIEDRKKLILESDINFQELDWLIKVAKLANIGERAIIVFMQIHMLDFYKTCKSKKYWTKKLKVSLKYC